MAFPTTGIIDDFNRADAATLGANWSVIVTGTARFQIFSNLAAGFVSAEYWNVQTYGPDCEAYATLVVHNSPLTGDTLDVRARIAQPGPAGTVDYYMFRWQRGSTGANSSFRLFRVDNGVATAIGSVVTGNLVGGDQLGISCVGSTITGYLNGTAICTATDATYSAAGYIGFSSATDSESDWENFGGGDLGPPPQLARPSSTVTSGSWTPSTGATLWGTLDETVADDADYDLSGVSPATDVMELGLQTLSDPAVGTGHKVRYRYGKDGAERIDIVVRLMQGATQIAAWTHTDVPVGPTTVEQVLTTTEADSITDYTNLRLRFEANKV